MKLFVLILALGSCVLAKSVQNGEKGKKDLLQKTEQGVSEQEDPQQKEQEVLSAWGKLVAVLAAKGLTPQDIGVGAPVPLPPR